MIRLLTLVAVVAAPLTAATLAQTDEGPPSRWRANTARHQKVIMYGVPAPYTAVRDPTPDTPTKLRRGRALFDSHCAACHGWSGQGNGPEGYYLVPAPADLEWLGKTPKNKADPYIYWSISEGGKQFDSEMPSFKPTLSKEQIWSLTAYLRAGMPYKSP